MRTPAHLCKERNTLRSHPVSDHSMAKIIQSYEAPGNEYFEQNLIPVHIDQVHPVEFVADEIARNSVCMKLKKQIKTQTEQSQKHLVGVELKIYLFRFSLVLFCSMMLEHVKINYNI